MMKKISIFLTALLLLISAQPMRLVCSAGTSGELWLARAVEAAARGESYTVMVSIASVLLNRVSSRCYPESLAAVIADAGLELSLNEPEAQALRAARDAMGGFDPTSGALNYSRSASAEHPILLFVDGWSFY